MPHGDNNPGLFEAVNEQSLYTVADAIDWRRLDDRPRLLPEDESHGIDCADVPFSAVAAYCRRDMHRRTSWVTVDGVDDTATYTVTVDGNDVQYAAQAGDGALEILQGLRDAINADATVTDLVTADLIDDDEDGNDDTLRLRGDDPDNYTLFVSTSSAPAELSATQEATHFELVPFVYPSDTGPTGSNPERWGFHPHVGVIDVDLYGLSMLKIPTNSVLRLDFQVRNDDGDVYIFAGPARLE